MTTPAPDTRQHQLVEDLKEMLEIGATALGKSDMYEFRVFDAENGRKFIGVSVEGHTEDLDELSEWALEPERS